jgi:hypothetical protein
VKSWSVCHESMTTRVPQVGASDGKRRGAHGTIGTSTYRI